MALGDHKLIVNGIMSLLCREHFPGLVWVVGEPQPAYIWEHYVACDDAPGPLGRRFHNKAERVNAVLWVSLLNTSHSLDILEKT